MNEVANLPVVAQTPPQLYGQLLAQGRPNAVLESTRDACLLAARQTAGLLRGSGKPFVCHLIGVASLVAETTLPATAVVAAVLHAVYQSRVPFAGAELALRRAQLRQRFGEEVESLVHDYDAAGALALQPTPLLPGQSPAVRILQLADELEDAHDGGPWCHGSPSDSGSERGSAGDRMHRLRALQAQFELAPALGAPSLWLRYQTVVNGWDLQPWPSGLRSGEYTSFAAVPIEMPR